MIETSGKLNELNEKSIQENQTVDLSNAGVRKQISDRIKADIDNFCSDFYDDGPRSHLGASQIGHPCDRNLWFLFRWIAHKKHTGRMQRLFQRGHLEEERFAEYFRGIGCKVQQFMEGEEEGNTIDKGKRQIRISGCNGHFGGSLDYIITLPEHYGIGNVLFLGEGKTSGTGSKFTELLKKGVSYSKPQHFAQKSIYGYKLGLQYGIYICANKNDDDLHIELVKLDWNLGAKLEAKADSIINATSPPPKLSQSPAFQDCSWCDFKEQCHNGKPIDRNCRSCKEAKPVDNAEWMCLNCSQIIPKDFLKTGCNNWKGVI